MALLHLNSSNFEEEVLNSKVPVVVDFYADWCGPCKMIAPIIEKLAGTYDGTVKIAKLNVDDAGEIAQKYDVTGIPTVIFYKGGEPKDRFSSALPEQAICDFIDRNNN